MAQMFDTVKPTLEQMFDIMNNSVMLVLLPKGART
ncbi:hypothetical protein G1C97_0711 [Bifidobacterium sp. DSM 109959]|uniref:Uncharacterized protein n=1 Tax=Bifidobacterium olomucense TaxID=2675324 RepID=A0A7Y0EWJ9_9BIFI|nr:hypothetical protein [Bifidobacterium sp. DSM 109959]